jgi:rare lipoprotein A
MGTGTVPHPALSAPAGPADNQGMMPGEAIPTAPAPVGSRRGQLAALVVALLVVAGGSGCGTSRELAHPRAVEVGMASYYGRPHDGRRTASGEVFDMHAMTAAHPSLPFGTRVRVTNLANGRHAVVRINDRGPHRKQRIIDLSYAAARELDMVGAGVARVRVEVLSAGS